MTNTATGSFEHVHEQRGCCGGAKGKKMPWSLYEVGAMVGGFVVFWPLGLLALFLKFKNGEMWRGASSSMAPWSSWKKPDFEAWKNKTGPFSGSPFSGSYANTGNAAFDDYKRSALARLEEERRKLEDEQRAFGEHLAKLRKAKDQDEFDRFMAERNAPSVSE